MKVEFEGMTIEVDLDGDGFPLVSIETGGNYESEKHRPAIQIEMNGVTIHEMFDEQDNRWYESQEQEENFLDHDYRNEHRL